MAGVNLFPDQAKQGGNLFPEFANPPANGGANLFNGGASTPRPDVIQAQPVNKITRPELTWGEVAQSAVKNIPSSGAKMFKDIWTAISSPIETGGAIMDIGKGIAETLIPGGEDKHVPAAKAVGEYLHNRFLTMDGFKRAVAEDPVGILGDISTVLTAGGYSTARLPGVAGRIGNIASKAGNIVEPVNVAMKGSSLLGRKVLGPAAAATVGLLTGTGRTPVEQAFKSGMQGGDAGRAFRGNIRNQIPAENIVTEARGAIANLRNQRGAAYRAEMAKLGKNEAIIDWKPIDQAIDKVADIGRFKGQVIDASTAKVWEDITKVIDNWKSLDPAEFHTALGMDHLKQQIGSIAQEIASKAPPGKIPASQIVADNVYNAIKSQIIKQDGTYAKTMGDYEKASEFLRDAQKSLHLGNKASTDQALRGLNSVVRNNVNTNYGARLNAAQRLTEAGAPNLLDSISGQAMSALPPRGLQGAGAAGLGTLLAVTNPSALPAMLATSPRLMGEATHATGRLARPLAFGAQKILPPGGAPARLGLMQAGRLQQELENRGR